MAKSIAHDDSVPTARSTFRLVLPAALLAAGCATSPASPPTSWRSVGAGGGGAMFSPSFSPHSNDLYASCDMSELFRSTDLGATWNPVHFLQMQANRSSRVQFTNDPQIVYTVNHIGEVPFPARSNDGGVTWTAVPNDPTGGECYSIWADPADANRLVVSSYDRIYFTSNAGTNWALRYTALTGSGLYVTGAFFDGTTIFIGCNDGLLISTNNGTSFSIASTTGFPAGKEIVSFAAAKESGNIRLWALVSDVGTTYGGLTIEDLFYPHQDTYRLDWDGTPSWELRNTGLPTGLGDGLAYIAAPLNDIDVAWVAGQTNIEEPMVYRTTNGGGNWSSVLNTSTTQNVYTGWAGRSGDRGWSYGGGTTGFTVSPNDGNKAAFTDYGFFHLTTDGGTTWRQAYLNPADQNLLGAPTPKNKAYHGNGLENTSCWWLTWSSATEVFASCTDIRGIRSTDGGDTWSFNYTGHTENTAYHVIRRPSDGVLYMATSTVHDLYQSTYLTDARIDGGGGRVLMSANNGATWTLLHNFSHPVIWLSFDPNNASRLYASVVHSTQGGIYVTNDLQNGASSAWSPLTAPPRTEGHPFNIHVLNDGTLVATYSGRRTTVFTQSSGVFVSTNGGTSWIDRSHSGMLYWTKDLVIDPNDPTQNTWYVGVFSGWGGPPNGLGGLYRTTNRGVSWTRISALDRVTSCTIDPSSANEMYVTTETDGLWHTANLNNASPTLSRVASYPFRQPERVFFNPYNANEIWVTSFGNAIRIGTKQVSASVIGWQLF